MATMQQTRSETVQITIPADCLEDARSALVGEINIGSDALRGDQADVMAGRASGREDRAMAMRLLRKDVALLDELLDATGDTKVTAERETITGALEAIVRVLSGRLVEATDYAPVEMGAVLELAARLRWAALEAVRIEPGLGDGPVA